MIFVARANDNDFVETNCFNTFVEALAFEERMQTVFDSWNVKMYIKEEQQ